MSDSKTRPRRRIKLGIMLGVSCGSADEAPNLVVRGFDSLHPCHFDVSTIVCKLDSVGMNQPPQG